MTTLFYNPALRQEPQDKPLTVLPYVSRETLLEWLERTDRLKPDEDQVSQVRKTSEDSETLEDLETILEPIPYAQDNKEEDLN